MLRGISRTALLTAAFVLSAGLLSAQNGSFSGKVIGEDGSPLQGAMVKIERLDVKGNYQVKTNKKGEYFHAGLPLGEYKISVEVDGKIVDSVKGIRTSLNEVKEQNFDLAASKKRAQALAKAAETGTLTQEQARDMSPEQKAQLDKQVKERSAAMAKNKALNDAFNAGMTAKEAKDYPAAIDNFKKAAEMDPKQPVIWANMAETYTALANTKAGPERDQALQSAADAYVKALEMKPEDAALHNNYALTLIKQKKIDEGKAELQKAATIDPAGAGKYYFNLGAILVNSGQTDAAIEAFKKATEADPNYADAYFQYATALSGKMQTTADGKVIPPPGMKEALEKYLQLKPDGPYAEGAKGLLALTGAQLETKYENPDAKKAAQKSGTKKK